MYPHHSRRAIFVRAPRRRPGRRLFIIGVAIGVGFTLGIWPPLPVLEPSIAPATASEQPILETPAPLPWYAVHETPSRRAPPCRGPGRAPHCRQG